jgi:hypothetical protein
LNNRWVGSLAAVSIILSVLSLSIIQALAYSGGFSITKSSSFIDDSGRYHVVGEIRNDSYSSRIHINIFALFYDSNYTVVGTSRGYPDIQILHIGKTSRFEIVFEDSQKTASIAGYTLQTIAGRAYHPSYPQPTVQTSSGVYEDFYHPHSGIESMAATTHQAFGIKGGEYSPENGNWSSVAVFVNLQNTDDEVLNYTLIMEVRNESGITEFVYMEPESILQYSSYGTRYYWMPEEAGEYEIRFTVIRDSDDTELLAPVLVEHVTITD